MDIPWCLPGRTIGKPEEVLGEHGTRGRFLFERIRSRPLRNEPTTEAKALINLLKVTQNGMCQNYEGNGWRSSFTDILGLGVHADPTEKGQGEQVH